jgi:hypothetical protein
LYFRKCPKCRFKNLTPGANVKITIFGEFEQFFERIGDFLEKKLYNYFCEFKIAVF